MNRDCIEGFRLRRRFENELKRWGWFDAFERAVETMPLGIPKIHEFQRHVRSAETSLYRARHAYAEHMANCLKCSRKLVTTDAIPTIYDKLKENEDLDDANRSII